MARREDRLGIKLTHGTQIGVRERIRLLMTVLNLQVETYLKPPYLGIFSNEPIHRTNKILFTS